MKPSPLDSSITRKNAHAPLDRRYAERVPIQFRVMYSTEADPKLVKGEGSLRDLSKSGCKVTAAVVPHVGSSITLFLYIEDGNPPMCLTGTTVSWVAGHLFAAKFPKLTSEERRRLQDMIWKHATLLPTKHQRAAFRIV